MSEQLKDEDVLEKKNAQPGKYLTFKLGNEEYGIEILKVKDIIQIMPITRVPKTPPSIRGVINLRGLVIPVIDLKRKFGLNTEEESKRPCIIAVSYTHLTLPTN